MVFKLFTFQDILSPLGLTRLFNLTIKENEFKRCYHLLQTLNELGVQPNADLDITLTQHLIASDFAWLEQFHERLRQDLQRQEGALSFFAWVKPLFHPFYERRLMVKQCVTENQAGLKQLKQNLKSRLLILLDQKRHGENTLAPEIVLSFEKWLMAHYPDSILPALSLSQTYLPPDYAPILTPVTALKRLSDVQKLFEQLKKEYPLIPLSQFSLRTIFDTLKNEIKQPGYGLTKLPFLITGALSAYLGLPTLLTLGIFFYALFRNTTIALWDAALSISQHVHWGWQKLARGDQLTNLIHFGPYLLQLEDAAIFTRDWLATGPLDLATLETTFYQNAINARLDSLTHTLTALKTLSETAHQLSDRKIYQRLAAEIEQAKDHLVETAGAFAQQIAQQASIAFRLPDATHLKPRLSPEQVQRLREFIVQFGLQTDLQTFDTNTDPIQLFLNILINQSANPRLTLPFTTPKAHRTMLPFGIHDVNKIALKINKCFVLKYETNPQKALAFKNIIRILKGKKRASNAQLQEYLGTLGAAAIDKTIKQIGHHLFLTQDSFTTLETELFPKEDKLTVKNWFQRYGKNIKVCLRSLWAWFESRLIIGPQSAVNAALLLKGHGVYQQIRGHEPTITIAAAQKKLMELIATFKGEHLGFLSFVFPFWDNAPPSSLLDACLKKRLEYALDHSRDEDQKILLDDLSLHLPTPNLQLLNEWAEKKLAGDAAYSETTEKNVLIPLSERGLVSEETLTHYRRKGLNQLLSS